MNFSKIFKEISKKEKEKQPLITDSYHPVSLRDKYYIEDADARNAALARIRDKVVDAGFEWNYGGICTAKGQHYISYDEYHIAIVNLGDDIQYL